MPVQFLGEIKTNDKVLMVISPHQPYHCGAQLKIILESVSVIPTLTNLTIVFGHSLLRFSIAIREKCSMEQASIKAKEIEAQWLQAHQPLFDALQAKLGNRLTLRSLDDMRSEQFAVYVSIVEQLRIKDKTFKKLSNDVATFFTHKQFAYHPECDFFKLKPGEGLYSTYELEMLLQFAACGFTAELYPGKRNPAMRYLAAAMERGQIIGSQPAPRFVELKLPTLPSLSLAASTLGLDDKWKILLLLDKLQNIKSLSSRELAKRYCLETHRFKVKQATLLHLSLLLDLSQKSIDKLIAKYDVELIDAVAEIEKIDSKPCGTLYSSVTSLGLAAYLGRNKKTLNALLKRGASFYLNKNPKASPPILFAVLENQLNVVKYFVEREPKMLQLQFYNMHLVTWALCANTNVSIAFELIHRGAKIDYNADYQSRQFRRPSVRRLTALQLACLLGHEEAINIILRYDDGRLLFDAKGYSNSTPVELAAKTRNVNAFLSLIFAGAALREKTLANNWLLIYFDAEQRKMLRDLFNNATIFDWMRRTRSHEARLHCERDLKKHENTPTPAIMHNSDKVTTLTLPPVDLAELVRKQHQPNYKVTIVTLTDTGHILNDVSKQFSDRLRTLKGDPIIPAPNDLYLCVWLTPINHPLDRSSERLLPSTLFKDKEEGDTISFIMDGELMNVRLAQKEHCHPSKRINFEDFLQEIHFHLRVNNRPWYMYKEDLPEDSKLLKHHVISNDAKVTSLAAQGQRHTMTEDDYTWFKRVAGKSFFYSNPIHVPQKETDTITSVTHVIYKTTIWFLTYYANPKNIRLLLQDNTLFLGIDRTEGLNDSEICPLTSVHETTVMHHINRNPTMLANTHPKYRGTLDLNSVAIKRSSDAECTLEYDIRLPR